MNKEKYIEMQKVWADEYGPIADALIESFRVRFDLNDEEYEKFCEWTENN